MKARSGSLLVVFLPLFIFFVVMKTRAGEPRPPGIAGQGQDSAVERAALMRLYESTQGSIWIKRDGWGGPDSYCTWYGVTCDVAHHVLALELPNNSLVGPLPAEIADLAGLQRLDFSFNELQGPLPEELGDLAQLRSLDLSANFACTRDCYGTLGGPIPVTLGRLSKLQVLDLSGNVLAGSIPAQLGDLHQLLTLDLSHNVTCNYAYFPPYLMDCSGGLVGTIPAALSAMPALQTLRLNHNLSLCWETTAARDWALGLPQYAGPTDCTYLSFLLGSPVDRGEPFVTNSGAR